MVKHRIILTGGGTGGHIYPALAVAERLIVDSEVDALLYIGATGHLEERLASERGLEFSGLNVSGFPRRLGSSFFSWPFQLAAAVMQAQRLLRKFKPTVLLGTGGYASAAPIIAANMMDVPYAIHEPDAHPGLVNRTFARNAAIVSCGMEGALGRLNTLSGKVVVNGNPVSEKFLNPMKRDGAAAVLGLDPGLKTVLVTGGSQGARAINDAVRDALPRLLDADPPVQVIHQVGVKNVHEYRESLAPHHQSSARYFIRDYFDDLSLAYSLTDVAVCRAGAMTIAELSVVGCPAIFIPYPFAAADHQTHNARFMASRNAALVLEQGSLSGASLAETLLGLIHDDVRLKSMRQAMRSCARPQAAQDLADQLKEISTNRQIRRQKSAAPSHSQRYS